MSVNTVTYDFSEIDKEFKKSSYSRSTKLLEDILSGTVCERKRSTGYKKVLDSGARFINLFGLFVDVNSGDIALGLFPNPNDYISIGNIYDLIAKYQERIELLEKERERLLAEIAAAEAAAARARESQIQTYTSQRSPVVKPKFNNKFVIQSTK